MWHNTTGDERLRDWKKFRTEILHMGLDEQLSRIAQFFASFPYATRTLDYYDPCEWPTPWEILYHGSYCKSSISILMYHTLDMIRTGHKTSLYLIDDGDEYLVPVVDDQFVLNYHLGSVNSYSAISSEFRHILTIAATQIRRTK